MEATSQETDGDSEETKDRRLKALRRLEAVRGHLIGFSTSGNENANGREMLGEAERFLKSHQQ